MKFPPMGKFSHKKVAPYAGAWIEIPIVAFVADIIASLPTRERGLKFVSTGTETLLLGRSLRGSVD